MFTISSTSSSRIQLKGLTYLAMHSRRRLNLLIFSFSTDINIVLVCLGLNKCRASMFVYI